MKRIAVWLCACALLAPAVAWAHATLKFASPGFGTELAVSPNDTRARLHLDGIH